MTRRVARSWAALRLAVLILIFAGCAANARQAALRGTLAGLNGARDGFLAYDQRHQEEIVAGATSLADGQAKLASYRAHRDPVAKAFMAAYAALALASLDTTAASLEAAVRAAAALYEDLKAFKGVPAIVVPPHEVRP